MATLWGINQKINLKLFQKSRAVLGECPLWDSGKKLLYWIDIVNKKIFCINIKNNIFCIFSLEVFVGSIALRKNGRLIVASNNGLFFFNQDILSFDSICNPEEDLYANMFDTNFKSTFFAVALQLDQCLKREEVL